MTDGLNAAGIRADARREQGILAGLTAPSFIILGLLLFIPVGWLFWLSLFTQGVFTFENYVRMAVEPAYLSIFMTTFKLSVLVTVLAVLLGYPVAYMIAMLPPRAASVCLTLVLVPFWTALLVRTYAWLVLLQRNGVLNEALFGLGLIKAPMQMLRTEGAVVLAMSHVLLPFMVLPLYAALRAIPDDYGRAARMLGASSLSVFRHVVLPLSLSGISAGCLIVFLMAMGFFVTPALIGGPQQMMLATLVQQQVTELLNWPFAGALVGVLLAFVLALVLLFNRVVRLDRFVGQV